MSERPRPLPVALDVGPLIGVRTGVAVVVDALLRALTADERVIVQPYVLSMRAPLEPGVRRLPLPAAAAHRLWAVAGVPRVDRWLQPAAVIHGTNYVVPPSRLPRVVTVHDCWFLAHPELAAPAVARAGAVLRRAVAGGAWVHAVSAATAARARELLATERVVTVHNGPPPPLAEPQPPPWTERLTGRPFVLAIGTIERRKNLPALVRAFGQVGSASSRPALVIGGAPGDDAAALDAVIAALPAERRGDVHLIGHVDGGVKSWLLHHAAVVAYPSLDEGFGFPILEAQAAGTPVVATDAGAIPEVAGTGAELVPVGHDDLLAAALTRVLTDDDRRSELIAAGRANVARFSWIAAADALVELYHRLAAEPDR